jgi:hypothetical protein
VILDEDPDSPYYGLFEAGMEIFMSRYVIEPEFMAAACLDPIMANFGATRALLEAQKSSHTKVLLKVIKNLKISEVIKEKRQNSESSSEPEQGEFQTPTVPVTPTPPGPQSQALFDSFPFDTDASISTQVITFIFAYFFVQCR